MKNVHACSICREIETVYEHQQCLVTHYLESCKHNSEICCCKETAEEKIYVSEVTTSETIEQAPSIIYDRIKKNVGFVPFVKGMETLNQLNIKKMVETG